jgi:hypothetical protein
LIFHGQLQIKALEINAWTLLFFRPGDVLHSHRLRRSVVIIIVLLLLLLLCLVVVVVSWA